MTRTRGTASVAPVSADEFGNWSDAMLWNPHLSRARWRRAQVRAALPATVVLVGGVAGAGIAVVGWGWANGVSAALMSALGVLVLARAAFAAVNLDWSAVNRGHPCGRRCRMEQLLGEYFYRTGAFADLGTDVHTTVTTLVEAVGQLHRTPSRAWIDQSLPGEAHRVVWEALCCLDRTRPARVLAQQLRADPDAGELAAAVEEAVTGIDRALGEVLTHLRRCLALTRAWEAKLHHTDLHTRTEDVLAVLREIRPSRLVAVAEPLPQTVFAYLTAARDVTDTGPFPWEQRFGPALSSARTDHASDAADRTSP